MNGISHMMMTLELKAYFVMKMALCKSHFLARLHLKRVLSSSVTNLYNLHWSGFTYSSLVDPEVLGFIKKKELWLWLKMTISTISGKWTFKPIKMQRPVFFFWGWGVFVFWVWFLLSGWIISLLVVNSCLVLNEFHLLGKKKKAYKDHQYKLSSVFLNHLKSTLLSVY